MDPLNLTPEDPRPDRHLPGPEVAETLRRILAAVESERRQGGIELALVIILSLSALGSTWCAYQSQLWNGTQLVRLSEADLSSQDAHESALAGLTRRMFDGMVFLHFIEAMQRHDTQLADAMHRRMRSPVREALDAWLALDPLNNPDAPRPDRMPQYVLVEEQNARREREKASESRAAAQQAGQNGDTYVLLTLVFASVLFFGGITGTFQSRRLRWGLGGIATALFLVIVIALATMPVCRG